MRSSQPFQYINPGDSMISIDAVHALWGGPKYIELWNAAAATWVPGQWAMLDLVTATVATLYGSPGAAMQATLNGVLCLGVFVDAAVQGQRGRIQVFGKYPQAAVLNTVAAVGTPLSISATAGSAEAQGNVTAAAAYRESIGVALTASGAGGLQDVFIFNRLGIG
jgi:hypothetical protein